MKKMIFITKVLLGFIIISSLVACGGTSTSSKASTSANIISASSEQITDITEGMNKGLTVSDFKTIKSKDFKNLYFLSATITYPNGETKTGLWATGGRTNISTRLSININASSTSPWPYGPSTSAKITEKDDGAGVLLKSYK